MGFTIATNGWQRKTQVTFPELLSDTAKVWGRISPKTQGKSKEDPNAPDPKNRLPRELLKELIEEGSEAFRGVLEKLLNTAMQMEREEFLGARRWERSEQRRDHANGYKDN